VSRRTFLRFLVVGGGAVVVLAGLIEFRLADWPIYAVFLLVYLAVAPAAVEVLPRLGLPVPDMAVTIGFLYIGGLPIAVVRGLTPLLTRLLSQAAPERWKDQFERLDGLVGRRELFFRDTAGWETDGNLRVVSELGLIAFGLGVRWWIAQALVPHGLPAENPGAIATGEIAGYATWGLLSLLPIYPDRPLLPLLVDKRGLKAALADVGLIVGLALTPFVFLITYGYRSEGLLGAAAWSLSTLGLHFMLKRLNERRVTLEEQNRRLEALNRELEHRERLSAIGKMSSVVSHEILHQLGIIGIHADLIRNADGEGAPEESLAQARQNAQAIEAALGDVNRVLKDLLVFSRDLRLNLYEHSLKAVLDEALADCLAYASERGVELRLECPEGIFLPLDKLKLKQALLNVLRNAVEASPKGEAVVVRADVQEGFATVRVSDRGPGVPPSDREQIFAPFFTTKEYGTGLGLAIAREFVNAHGGRLFVDSAAVESVSTFVLKLPLMSSAAVAAST
jgi:signal transduction histidine kinase